MGTRYCYRDYLDHNTLINGQVRWSIKNPQFVGKLRMCLFKAHEEDLQIPPNLLLYLNVDPLVAVIVDPSPPETVNFELGPEVLVGFGTPVPVPVELFEALFFGLITVK